jgi:hypothetical protein
MQLVFIKVVGQILEVKDLGNSFQSLGWYFTTVLAGIIIHGCIVLPIIYGEMTLSGQKSLQLL